ncbi:TNT domain-containing protein [Mycolicibacterium setense]|uniref:TNT domain-containing protein n=1 Tax=Mycolicibacterium setense TaxID=431269 RepID=UPI0012FEF5B7|nr:TNT domain-containing protein [Mycolicibacterium setense]
MLSDSLGAALSGGIASGMDLPGANFGLTYGDLAQNFADLVADAANALKAQGYMLEATGFNYKNADAASTVGGSGPSGGVGEVPSTTSAADVPLGPTTIIVPPPGVWGLIAPLVPLPWPSGVPALMGITAAQWATYANGFAVVQVYLDRVKNSVAGDVQHLSEGPRINEVMQILHEKVADLEDLATKVADKVKEFADGVQEAQDAIRRILNRLSFGGLMDTVKGVFTGEGLKVLREVAHDVMAVLKYLQNQVKAIVGLLGQLAELIGNAATELQGLVKVKLEEAFGEEVGGALSAAFTAYTDFQVGVLSGVIGTVAGVVSMVDPDTWIGMYEVGMSVVEDPSKADDVLLAMGREFFAVDELTGDHPGRGIGEAGFNILSSFNPAGAASKAGIAAKGLKAAKGALEADGKLSKLGDLAKMGTGKGKLDGLDSAGSPKAPEAPEFASAPGIPESVIGPKAPNDFGAPPSRPGLDGPSGPHESPAPSNGHHGGGGDDPPDPPGRATGPSESGTSHSSGPTTQSPTSAGPGHPADSPHSPAPSTPSHTPPSGHPVTPNINHAPETSSPANTPDSGQSQPGNGQPPTSHEPSSPETHNNGQQTADGQGHSPGVREDTGQGPVENHTPSEANSPGSGEHNGPSDERAHTPTDHQPAHEPQTPSGGHERGTPEGGNHQQEQPRPTHDGTTDRHEPGPATPVGVFAGGIPPAPHTPGTGHSVGDGSVASGKTPAPEPASRSSESKAPQGNSPENPRKQSADAAAGPAPRSTPNAPVNPAAESPASGSAHTNQQPYSVTDRESHNGNSEANHPDSGSPRDGLDGPGDLARDYDSSGRTIPTDQLVHPQESLLDRGLLDAASSNPNRVSDALTPGAPRTDPEVQAMVPNNYDPLGGLSEDAWKREYWPSGRTDARGNPELVWPDPETQPQGFSTPECRTPTVLNPGERFDRFGPGFGQFGSPLGTEFPDRALPPHSLDAGYHRYEVVRPIPIWEGPIAPAMGQPGGGTQYYFPNSIVDLVNAGYLKEVPA